MDRTMQKRRIRAAIDPAAISRVSRFFDATTRQIIEEMLQNARRSGATQVTVETTEQTVTISDNGNGISDPAKLLAFGGTNWEAETRNAEEPAGMGFFSIARRAATVQSRARGRDDQNPPTAKEGWRVELTPDVFLGKKSTVVEPHNGAPAGGGTRVTFTNDTSAEEAGIEARDAAYYYPLPVNVNNKPARQARFLEGTTHNEEWRGLEIGIHQINPHNLPKGRINFHGVIVERAALPTMTSIEAYCSDVAALFHAEVNVHNCPELELVLPARRHVIHNAFLKKLQKAALGALYRAVASSDAPFRVPYHDWRKARDMGIEVRAAPAELQPWTARGADKDNDTRWYAAPPVKVPTGKNTRVLLMDDDVMMMSDQVALERAVKLSTEPILLLSTESRYEGYEWYNRIERVTGMLTGVQIGGKTQTVEEERKHAKPLKTSRPQRITFELSTQLSNGEKGTLTLESDLAFGESETTEAYEIGVLLTADSKLTSAELTELMVNGHFDAFDNPEALDATTQQEMFERECREIATSLTASAREARIERLHELAGRYMASELEPNETLTIRKSADGTSHGIDLKDPAATR